MIQSKADGTSYQRLVLKGLVHTTAKDRYPDQTEPIRTRPPVAVAYISERQTAGCWIGCNQFCENQLAKIWIWALKIPPK